MDRLLLTQPNDFNKLILLLLITFQICNQLNSQCSTSCSTDNASSGETSCIDIGIPVAGLEAGIDAINSSNEPHIISALNGNSLANKLDNCCGNEDDCVSIFFTVPDDGGAFSLEEINSLGSGSVFIDCLDLSNNFDEVIPFSAGQYEIIFCPPGGSGSKRIGFSPLFEIDAQVTNESIDDLNDGEIDVTYVLGNLNVPPSGTVLYSIDGIGGSTENSTGLFNNLSDGTYTVYVYDSANLGNYNTTDAYVAAGVVCDLNDPNADCDADGVINIDDCDPSDNSVLGAGSSCTTSGGLLGTLDINCYCIADDGGSSSGGDGGLESNNRLAQKIAARNFKLKKDQIELYENRVNGKIPFRDYFSTYKVDDINIEALIPIGLWNAYVAESTPLGLEDITNATEVTAADFYIEGVRTAVALIIKSENGVYEHSKYVCDRLDGAKLLDMTHTEILDQEFITYEIQNLNDKKEFAVSFSAYQIGNEMLVENHWNLDDYKSGMSYVNFQIWASSIEKLQSLTTSILQNLEKQKSIAGYNITGIPKSFVNEGFYRNGSLYLTVTNRGPAGNLEIEGNFRQTETGVESSYFEILNLNADTTENFKLAVGSIYDIGLVLKDQSGFYDGLFFADGTWGLEDKPENAQILSFEVMAQQASHDLNHLQIERNIQLEANVKNYQNIYRSLTPKWSSVDLTAYNNISFSASGKGRMEITLVKEDEKNWLKQIRKTIDLTEEEIDYNFKITDFDNFEFHEDIADIYMIVFTLVGNGSSYDFNMLNLKDLHFHSNVSTSVKEYTDRDIVNLYPNPAQDFLRINTDGTTISMIHVYSSGGQLVYKEKNINQDKLLLNTSMYSSGLYIISIYTDDDRIIHKKCIKTD